MTWQNKYGAKRTVFNGRMYDSRLEAGRAKELELLLAAGEISDLQHHVKFELFPPFTDNQGKSERGISYKCDFMYTENGRTIVEDVKSPPTRKRRDYILIRKLFKMKYPQYIFRETE